jgi:hypothetical protein
MSKFRLAVVLNQVGEFALIRKTVQHIARQTALSELELLIVCTKEVVGRIDGVVMSAIPNWRAVVVDELPYGAVGWAAGIAAADAEAVVLAEDHSYPEPNWAETLIEGHGRGYAMVAPEIRNGNPGTLVSWANFQLCFVEWFMPGKSGEVARGPGHNTSYLRSALLGMNLNLAEALISEIALHEKMTSCGHRMYLDGRTSTRHLNMSKPSALLAHSFLGGRIFGDLRSREWPLAKKAVYAIGFPLVPVLRIKRLFEGMETEEKRRESRLFAAMPWTVLGLFAHAIGEVTGYLFGVGNAMEGYQAFESRRIDFILPSERKLILD